MPVVLTKQSFVSIFVPLALAVFFALLGSWVFSAPLYLALAFSLVGCIFNLVIDWSVRVPGGKDNAEGEFLHPKYELAAFIFLFVVIVLAVQMFPKLKSYGFY